MKAYYIEYTYNGFKYAAHVDAKDKASARNKIGRKHGLKAEQAAREIKLTTVNVVGFY